MRSGNHHITEYQLDRQRAQIITRLLRLQLDNEFK